MKEYIEKEIVVDYLQSKLCSRCQEFETWTPKECIDCLATSAIESIKLCPSADVKPVVWGETLADEYGDCDQFICSKCGIHLQDWNLIEDDYEDGIVHEFVFNFCPNCGADMRERSEEG